MKRIVFKVFLLCIMSATGFAGSSSNSSFHSCDQTLMMAHIQDPSNTIDPNVDSDIINWAEDLDFGSNFNPLTGQYTAPFTGVYEITAIFNYTFNDPTGTANTGDPFFAIIKTSNVGPTIVLAGDLHFIQAVGGANTRTPVRVAQVPLHGFVVLNQGDIIQPVYRADNFNINPNIVLELGHQAPNTGGQTTFTVRLVSKVCCN